MKKLNVQEKLTIFFICGLLLGILSPLAGIILALIITIIDIVDRCKRKISKQN